MYSEYSEFQLTITRIIPLCTVEQVDVRTYVYSYIVDTVDSTVYTSTLLYLRRALGVMSCVVSGHDTTQVCNSSEELIQLHELKSKSMRLRGESNHYLLVNPLKYWVTTAATSHSNVSII